MKAAFFRSHKFILFPLTFMVFISCTESPAPQDAATPVVVKVGPVHQVKEHEIISATGYVVSPGGSTALSFMVSGRVATAGPREGDAVRAGQALASIDPGDYALAAKAAAAQARQAEVGCERARDEYQRMKFLYEQKSIAPNDFEKLKAVYEAAKEQLTQAETNDQAARKRLSDTMLRAPFNGYIARRGVEKGDLVAPGRPLFELVRLDPVEISIGVPEKDVRLVASGMTVTVTAPALPDQLFEGIVRNVSISAEPSTRTYMTRITVPNPRHLLKLGMVAEVRIQGNRLVQMLTLPGDAIVHDHQGVTKVFVYYPGKRRVYARRIEVGALTGKEIEITKGLGANDIVVYAGQERLQDGAAVTLAAAAEATGPQPATKRP